MWDWIGKLAELRREDRLAVLVTVVGSKGSTPRKQGARMVVLPDGTFFGTVGGGKVERYALEEARRFLDGAAEGSVDVPLRQHGEVPACGGSMSLHMELVNDDPALYLFGAGHIGQHLCAVLEGTPFRVHLVDEREEWMNAPGLHAGVIRHHGHWSDFIDRANWCERRSYVVIVSYDGSVDQQILEEVLPHPTRYVGMIGSQAKWRRVQKNLEDSDHDLSRVQCPIGHDNGGNAPREIAVSIASQLLATHYGKE